MKWSDFIKKEPLHFKVRKKWSWSEVILNSGLDPTESPSEAETEGKEPSLDSEIKEETTETEAKNEPKAAGKFGVFLWCIF